MDKIEMIYDLVREIDKKQDDQTERLVKLEQGFAFRTKDLLNNMDKTKKLEDRVEAVETPIKYAKNTVKLAGFISVFTGLIYSVMRLIPFIK